MGFADVLETGTDALKADFCGNIYLNNSSGGNLAKVDGKNTACYNEKNKGKESERNGSSKA